jgi:hypothetical protein
MAIATLHRTYTFEADVSAHTYVTTTLSCDHCSATMTRTDLPSAARVYARSIGWVCVGSRDECPACRERRRAAARAKLAQTETGRAVLRVQDRLPAPEGTRR